MTSRIARRGNVADACRMEADDDGLIEGEAADDGTDGRPLRQVADAMVLSYVHTNGDGPSTSSPTSSEQAVVVQPTQLRLLLHFVEVSFIEA
mmetsp:Transcript_13059/g.28621  ORF Transcript_13059/g.28621 Transcript_13059/m.28621 type:complete len:92 (+) Transcript_13059:7174-7449(+)